MNLAFAGSVTSNLMWPPSQYDPNGQKYVLASDRDSGVWIFQYTGG